MSLFLRSTAVDGDGDDTRLFEHLAIRPLIRLSLHLNRLIPAPLVLQESLVLWLGGVKLGEFVALKVRGNIKGRESLIATDEEGTSDDGVVGSPIDGGGSKEILARGFETIEETAWEIR